MIAFYQKAKTPSKLELQSEIEKLNFDFKFLEEFSTLDQFGGTCQLNGNETFFETHIQSKEEILDDYPFLNKDIAIFDSGISFKWGADYIAGACIGIISASLIDICNAKIVYVDDETWYSREMLVSEVPIFLEEHEKEKKSVETKPVISKREKKKKNIWLDFVFLGLMFISVILMTGKVISWHLPALFLGLYVGYSVWKEQTKRK